MNEHDYGVRLRHDFAGPAGKMAEALQRMGNSAEEAADSLRDVRSALALREVFMALQPRTWRQRLIEVLLCSWAGHRPQLQDSGLIDVCRDCGRVEVSREVLQ